MKINIKIFLCCKNHSWIRFPKRMIVFIFTYSADWMKMRGVVSYKFSILILKIFYIHRISFNFKSINQNIPIEFHFISFQTKDQFHDNVDQQHPLLRDQLYFCHQKFDRLLMLIVLKFLEKKIPPILCISSGNANS